MNDVSVVRRGSYALVEGPSWGNAEFYGRWLLAAAEAEAFWKSAYKDSEFQKQIDRVCVAYIPHFGISATLTITELRQYKTSLTIDLNSEEGESFAMMVAMGFFTFSAPRYQMTIPSHLTEKRMLSGAFGAFCARAAENPSDRSAIEAKRDSVFIGDFMIDLSLGLVRGCTSLANPFRAPGVFDSTRLTTYVTASYPPVGGLHHQ